MNDYSGKICPYCKTTFTTEDDIIVCSACDMPHHKDCWIENQGCTTFGCLGTINADDNAASSVTTTQMTYDEPSVVATPQQTYTTAAVSATQINNGAIVKTDVPVNNGVVFCTKCGKQNSNTDSFCSGCGNKLTTVQESSPQNTVYTQPSTGNGNPYSYVNQQSTPYQSQNSYQPGGYNVTYQPNSTNGIDVDVQLLIREKTDYYIPKFQSIKAQGKPVSWNWAACLVAPYWLMYRKMYVYAAIALAVDVIIAVMGIPLLSAIIFGAYIAFGVLGNSIYLKFLENKAAQVKSMNEPDKSQFIKTNGGVNKLAAVLAVIGRAVLVLILV